MYKKNETDRYFRHPAGMRDDHRIAELRRRFGADGYAAWLMVVEKLTDSPTHTLTVSECEEEGFSTVVNGGKECSIPEFIDCCVGVGLLQKEDDTIYCGMLVFHKEDQHEVGILEGVPQFK